MSCVHCEKVFAIRLTEKAIFVEGVGKITKMEGSISLKQKESEVKYVILIKSIEVTSGEVGLY